MNNTTDKVQDIIYFQRENEKLKIEIAKRREYELKITEEYEKIMRCLNEIREENSKLKENSNFMLHKSNSLKENEVNNI